jgi:hypothetical protein
MSANLQINLDPVALREATAQAIMGVLTTEVREQIIRQAVSAILQPSTDSWNRGKSPLQDAFESAILGLARDEARRLIAEDPDIGGKIKTLLREVADKVISADQDKMATKMADAFVASLKRDY